MKLYEETGYLSIEYILSKRMPFTFVVGGRGTGKTFGALKYLWENDIRFLLLRRTQTQCDLINKPEFSPFKPVASFLNKECTTQALSKNNAAVYNAIRDEDEKLRPVGSPICYTAALSTISSMRGFDASDVDVILYDEFIPERHERPLKNEADAVFNAYETINRNRELSGRPPVQLLCMANANDLANPLFLSLNLVSRADRMRETGTEVWTDPRRGICIIMLSSSKISQAKKGTALYQLTSGSEFAEMATENAFAGEERGSITSKKLIEYRPLVAVGEICIYRHKSAERFYVSVHMSGSIPVYQVGEIALQRFRKNFWKVWLAYLDDKIDFESYKTEILFNKYFNS